MPNAEAHSSLSGRTSQSASSHKFSTTWKFNLKSPSSACEAHHLSAHQTHVALLNNTLKLATVSKLV